MLKDNKELFISNTGVRKITKSFLFEEITNKATHLMLTYTIQNLLHFSGHLPGENGLCFHSDLLFHLFRQRKASGNKLQILQVRCNSTHTHMHAHTHFTALWDYPGEPVPEPIWTLLKQLKQEIMSGSGHQLGHRQIGTSPQTDNHANTPSLSFSEARCPSCCQTNSIKALKA